MSMAALTNVSKLFPHYTFCPGMFGGALAVLGLPASAPISIKGGCSFTSNSAGGLPAIPFTVRHSLYPLSIDRSITL